jgi:DnaK suppressor protein
MTLKPDELEYFREVLESQLDDLIKGAGKTVVEMTGSTDKNTFPDPTDRASLESDRNFELRIRDRERKLISKIRGTLEKIDKGTFGVCEVCGEPIERKRLEARPVTSHCIECKKDAETEEKIRNI